MTKDFFEETLESIIINSNDKLKGKGFPQLFANVKRQFRLPSGGVIDLFTFQMQGGVFRCRIIELKRENITIDAIDQAARYFFEIRGLSEYIFKNADIDMVIVGDSVNKNLRRVIPNLLYTEIYTYKYTPDGISFNHVNQGGFFNNERYFRPACFELSPSEIEVLSPKSIVFKRMLMDINTDENSLIGLTKDARI